MKDAYREKMERMLEEIRAEARMTSHYTGRPCFSEAVMRAMAEVPRHKFVPFHLRWRAYENAPLPIGHGQTISQPYIVALMTDLLDLRRDDIVLEIGTGSGYQAAILAKLVNKVYSVEAIYSLAVEAEKRLKELGITNVEIRHGDGHEGWPEHAPYDAIMLTAAAEEIPKALVDQLKPGGKMVVPVGHPGFTQVLKLVEKHESGSWSERDVLPVVFVPLVRL